MFQIGLLLLTGPFRAMVESISQYLRCANENIVKRLYVKIEPEFCKPVTKLDPINLQKLSYFVPLIYNRASYLCQKLDVRVLLSDRKYAAKSEETSNFDVIFTNSTEENQNIINYANQFLKRKCDIVIKLSEQDFSVSDTYNESALVSDCNFFKTACLGGTFDRLHNGHKVLLSEAALRAAEQLIVGVTDGPMLKRKVLWELIEPIHKRIADVTEFLLDVDPSLHYEVVPIIDPYGPTITNPDIDCIVVSAETKIGGLKVNAERKKHGMNELIMCEIDLVENSHRIPGEEQKLSSSTNRMHILGTCLKAPLITSNDFYTVLLQGQPLTGKSYISTSFINFGAIIINCNEIISFILSHNDDLKKIFSHKFNSKLVNSNGALNYKSLKCLCLKDKEARQWVAEHLSERVSEEIKKKIQFYRGKGPNLLLIKDTLLLDGNLKSDEINELWCTILPSAEVTKRLRDFYDLSEEDALNAVKSLPNNEYYVKKSHRIFCTQWSTDISEQQVLRAWSDIKTKENAASRL